MSKPLPPDWCFEALGSNGGRIVGDRESVEDLLEAIKVLATNPECVRITIHKRRRDYNPMLTVGEFFDLVARRNAWPSHPTQWDLPL